MSLFPPGATGPGPGSGLDPIVVFLLCWGGGGSGFTRAPVCCPSLRPTSPINSFTELSGELIRLGRVPGAGVRSGGGSGLGGSTSDVCEPAGGKLLMTGRGDVHHPCLHVEEEDGCSSSTWCNIWGGVTRPEQPRAAGSFQVHGPGPGPGPVWFHMYVGGPRTRGRGYRHPGWEGPVITHLLNHLKTLTRCFPDERVEASGSSCSWSAGPSLTFMVEKMII